MVSSIRRELLYVFYLILFILGSMLLYSCGKTGEEQLVETVDSFSNTYFNWQFHRAVAYCTPDSKRWLSYMASQVDQGDIDILRSQAKSAKAEVVRVNVLDGDSVARVEVKVSNFLSMDTIGAEGKIEEEARFIISAKFVDNQWKVWLTAPLRAERD
jgi:hypothetical protein